MFRSAKRNKKHFNTKKRPFLVYVSQKPFVQLNSFCHFAFFHGEIGGISFFVIGDISFIGF